MQISRRNFIGHRYSLRPPDQIDLHSKLQHILIWSYIAIWCNLTMVMPTIGQESQEVDQEYAKGIAAYVHCNYSKAIDHFRHAAELNPDDAEIQFYLGVSLSFLKAFDEAIDRLEKVLVLDASIKQAHYYLGWIYSQQGQHEKAQSQFQQAQEFSEQLTHYHQGVALYKLDCTKQAKPILRAAIRTNPDSPEARLARRYYAEIKRREHEQFLLQGTVSFQYDDNVILEPNDDAFAFGGQSDGRTVFALLGRAQTIHTAPWRFGAEYELFQSLHFELDEFNIQSHTGRLYTSLELHRATLRAETDYIYTLLDNNRFFEAFAFQPSVTIQQTRNLHVMLSMQYQRSNFFNQMIPVGQEDVRDRDGSALRVGFDQYLVLKRRGARLRLSYHYEASRNDGTDWEYNSHYIALELRMPLWWDIGLDASGGYTHRDFLHINSFDADPLAQLTPEDRRERSDDRFVLSLTLTRPIGPYLILSAGYTFTHNASNLDFFDYQRNIVALALTGRY